jgi:hypothetical protein
MLIQKNSSKEEDDLYFLRFLNGVADEPTSLSSPLKPPPEGHGKFLGSNVPP